MKYARFAKSNIKLAALAVSCLTAALAFPQEARAAAGAKTDCTVGTTCTIGEFIYDDNYDSVTGASCTITSRDPDGTIYINGTAMTESSEGDGWYYHEFTAPTTTGYYRTQVCCTVSGETMCIDKSFDSVAETSAPSSSSIAEAVWGYSSRSLTSFGDLIANIWANASRSLTSLNAGTTGVVNLEEVAKETSETRLLIERLVNAPIIENILEDDTPDLSEKIKETRAVANQLYVNTQYLTSKSGSLTTNWSRIDGGEALALVMEINALLGEQADSSSSDSIFGEINWIRDSWDWNRAHAIRGDFVEVKDKLTLVQQSLASYNKSPSAYYELKNAVKLLLAVEKKIGSTTDMAYTSTLYGQMKSVEEVGIALIERDKEANELLTNTKGASISSGLTRKVADLQRRVVALNKIPRIYGIFATKNTGDIVKDTRNDLFGIKGLISSNIKLLVNGPGKSLANTWMEEGSIIIRTLVTNPSNLISQEARIKYYLPPELSDKQILETDEGLEVKYDLEKDRFYVEGNFTLAAGETRSYSVKTEDIWLYSDEELGALRDQALDLSKPLEKTAYFAQSTTLKTDINVSLDKIAVLQGAANTPEQRIRAYREAGIEKNAVDEKMAALQSLVTQASASSSLFGFIGGAQTIAVWGIIVIVIAGFVFLSLYMRNLMEGKGKKGKAKKPKDSKKSSKKGGLPYNINPFIRYALPILIVGVTVSGVSAVIINKSLSKNIREEQVLSEKDEVVEPLEEAEDATDLEDSEGGLDIIVVVPPKNSSVNLRNRASISSEVVYKFKEPVQVIRLGEKGDWTNVLIEIEAPLEKVLEGWITSEYIVEVETLRVGYPSNIQSKE